MFDNPRNTAIVQRSAEGLEFQCWGHHQRDRNIPNDAIGSTYIKSEHVSSSVNLSCQRLLFSRVSQTQDAGSKALPLRQIGEHERVTKFLIQVIALSAEA